MAPLPGETLGGELEAFAIDVECWRGEETSDFRVECGGHATAVAGHCDAAWPHRDRSSGGTTAALPRALELREQLINEESEGSRDVLGKIRQ